MKGRRDRATARFSLSKERPRRYGRRGGGGFSKGALRTLSRMPANTARLIRSKVDQYAADPASLANNVKALAGEPGCFRLRVGDWRVVFNNDGEVIAVVRIAPRGAAYG